ncbi:MAG: hypothetical protein RBS88_06230 [Spongiibacteraceae bacterium]|jgi:hypothetical protein|nr:hypothetical protein [Spongiibacteraceae bacterium]
MEIRPVPLPATRVDPAPRTSPRETPAEVATQRPRDNTIGRTDRRGADRRRNSGTRPVVERRLGTERRRRTVDITV